ncbi:MAG TPA: aldo/keto reductase [Rhodocyclaceae bacterium]|nr:aldo/keto reductase [Rhodocyclaceae bacterium]
METRKLGSSDLTVSTVGLGCNNFGAKLDLEASRPVIHAALDAGITFFDTADTYGNKGGSETILGQILGTQRQHIVLATKFGKPMDSEGKRQGASPAYMVAALHDSLRRLQTDWIDLYQLHAPDPDTPIDDTLRAMDNLIQTGKVRYFGLSNFSATQLREVFASPFAFSLAQPVCCQDEYSLLRRGIESELRPTMESHHLGLLPYFPLANGLLSGKYQVGVQPPPETRLGLAPHYVQSYLGEEDRRLATKLQTFAEEQGHSLLELAFSWLAAQPLVASVIAGATTAAQVQANALAAAWKLSSDELARIDRICPGPSRTA